MVADVIDLARAAHLAVDIAGAALESAKEKAKVMLFVRRPEPNSHNRMEVVGHYDKLVKLQLWVLRRHLAPVFLDPAPELVQLASGTHDCAEYRLVVRCLPRDEEPAVAIVDVGVAKRLVEARHICRAIAEPLTLNHATNRSHAHGRIISYSLLPRPAATHRPHAISVRRLCTAHTLYRSGGL